MTTAHCATCRFMAAERYEKERYPSERDDDDPTKRAEHRTCTRVAMGIDCPGRIKDDQTNAPAVVVDGSGYSARLLVLPTFGCVLHEEKLFGCFYAPDTAPKYGWSRDAWGWHHDAACVDGSRRCDNARLFVERFGEHPVAWSMTKPPA